MNITGITINGKPVNKVALGEGILYEKPKGKQYEILEYINLNRTGSFETDYYPNPRTVLSIDLKVTGTFRNTDNYGGTGAIFLSYDGINAEEFAANFGGGNTEGYSVYNWNNLAYGKGGNIKKLAVNSTIHSRSIFEVGPNYSKWGGATINLDTKTTTQKTPLKLFRTISGAAFSCYEATLYNVVIKENGGILYNLIPVRSVEDGTLCLYNTISKTLIENKGGNTIIAGPATGETIYVNE